MYIYTLSSERAGIEPLIDTDDMIYMGTKPDWKVVFTYVQSLYRHLSRLQPPAIMRERWWNKNNKHITVLIFFIIMNFSIKTRNAWLDISSSSSYPIANTTTTTTIAAAAALLIRLECQWVNDNFLVKCYWQKWQCYIL